VSAKLGLGLPTFCHMRRVMSHYMWDYLFQFWNTYPKLPKFATVQSYETHETGLSTPYLFDKFYPKFLQKLFDENVLNSTFLFITRYFNCSA
jgi:hypothetical protein